MMAEGGAAAAGAGAASAAGAGGSGAAEPLSRPVKEKAGRGKAAAAATVALSGAEEAPAFSLKLDPSFGKGGSKAVPQAARRAAEQVTAALRAAGTKGAEEDAAVGVRCGVCEEEFKTRNLLFAHIRNTGHAVTKDAPMPARRVPKGAAAVDEEDEGRGGGKRKGKR